MLPCAGQQDYVRRAILYRSYQPKLNITFVSQLWIVDVSFEPGPHLW